MPQVFLQSFCALQQHICVHRHIAVPVEQYLLMCCDDRLAGSVHRTQYSLIAFDRNCVLLNLVAKVLSPACVSCLFQFFEETVVDSLQSLCLVLQVAQRRGHNGQSCHPPRICQTSMALSIDSRLAESVVCFFSA